MSWFILLCSLVLPVEYIVWTLISLVIIVAVIGLLYGSVAASSQVVSLSVSGYSLGKVLVVDVSNVGTVRVKVCRLYLSDLYSVVRGCRLVNDSLNVVVVPGRSVTFMFVGSSCDKVKKVVVVTNKGVFSGIVS